MAPMRKNKNIKKAKVAEEPVEEIPETENELIEQIEETEFEEPVDETEYYASETDELPEEEEPRSRSLQQRPPSRVSSSS